MNGLLKVVKALTTNRLQEGEESSSYVEGSKIHIFVITRSYDEAILVFLEKRLLRRR